MINIIKKYISKISKIDIYNFGIKNNIKLNANEINIIFNVINFELGELLVDSDSIFLKYKNNFTVENYNKTYKLFNEYKKRYKNYL